MKQHSTSSLRSTVCALTALLCVFGTLRAGEALTVLEPEKTETVAPRKSERERWSWNQPMANITATGDLEWKPQAFKFEKGASVRYIDYDKGSDDKDGLTTVNAWKHHPWDPAATGTAKACSGIQTYVFKRGVIYRGTLNANESGKPGDPIRLTSDPAWGEGEAVIAGSETVTGWKKGTDRKDIPEADKVWWVDVAFQPRNVWEVSKTGIERIPLARIPHWKVSDSNDVMSEWWSWEQPEWWTGKWHINFGGHRAHMGIDTKHLDKAAEYYVGATVRTEFAVVMGTPYPAQVEGFDAAKKGLVFQGIWTGDSENIWTGNRYYLEDKPQFLEVPGEFWAERKDGGARVYLRLPGDRDPNTATLELGHYCNLIESKGLSDVAISALTFRWTNTHWDLWQPGWGHPDVPNAAIRVLGSSDGLRVANCRFEHVAQALRLEAVKPEEKFGHFAFTDNDVVELDHGCMEVKCGSRGDVEVLRNKLHVIGKRPFRQNWGHAICIEFPETMQLAGNILDRCYGSGIFVFGGKGGGDTRDVANSRSLIHDNRVVDSLLSANDWGGIETWQCGPHYVYNNISGNAVGYWNCTYKHEKKGSACLGFNYYFDGSFDNSVFNNVAWGGTSDRTSKFFSGAAFYEAVPTVQNTFFNNTAAHFVLGSNWSPSGGRHMMLGNLLIDISGPVFQWGQLKEDKGPAPAAYPLETTALSKNIFANCGGGPAFATFEASGKGYADFAATQSGYAAHKPLAADVGSVSTTVPVKDADKTHDFHPVAGSAAVDGGVKVFVPWGVGRTVGEWHFRRNNSDPTVLLDDHWYPTSYFVMRETYFETPVWPLKGINIAAKDYVAGPLEDWTDSALVFNGTDQYAVLANDALSKPFDYMHDKKKMTAQPKDLTTPNFDTQNMLIEMYVQPKAGQDACAIVSKLAENGYRLALNKAGGVTLTLSSGAAKSELASGAKIADGKWHHVLAEVDRAAGTATIYTDGQKTAAGKVTLDTAASLSNTADFVVGKGYAGGIEYLRVARGTLADSHTTIEELYDWEFDGPFLRDFAGNAPAGKHRSAGAFEPAK